MQLLVLKKCPSVENLQMNWVSFRFLPYCSQTLVLIASENMIADIGTAARPAPALKIAGAAIYGDLASHQSVTSPLQPNTLGKRKRCRGCGTACRPEATM
jgi:hypothetical protein